MRLLSPEYVMCHLNSPDINYQRNDVQEIFSGIFIQDQCVKVDNKYLSKKHSQYTFCNSIYA